MGLGGRRLVRATADGSYASFRKRIWREPLLRPKVGKICFGKGVNIPMVRGRPRRGQCGRSVQRWLTGSQAYP